MSFLDVLEGLRFKKASSPIHKLDPRVKFALALSLSTLALAFKELLALIALFTAHVPLILLGGVIRQWARMMKGASLFAFFIFLTNFLFIHFHPGYAALSPTFVLPISMALRFLTIVGAFSCFFLTTSPDDLGLALERHLVPFTKWLIERVPRLKGAIDPYGLCFAFIASVRFIPTMVEEATSIVDAQRARGLELDRGGLLKRIRGYVPILIPMVINALRRSDELAEAMESRAWGAVKERTSLYELRLKKGDAIVMALTALAFAIAVYVRISIPIPL